MPFAEWKRRETEPDLFDVPVENPDKMLILAADILLDPVAQSDDMEARERLKIACARAHVLYDAQTVAETLDRARGRRRA